MTRKNYIEIAADVKSVLAACETHAERAIVRIMADNLASTLKRDNGRFDRARFMEACGL